MEIRFGPYSLDTDRQELTGPGGRIDVEPQVFALLTFLAENADRVVAKDEIIEAVWDGRIVSDANLNSRINAARKAVGDDGKAQAVIRTYPRRGFRFVAEIEAEGAVEPAAQALFRLLEAGIGNLQVIEAQFTAPLLDVTRQLGI